MTPFFLRKFVLLIIVLLLAACSKPRTLLPPNPITQTAFQSASPINSATSTSLSASTTIVTSTPVLASPTLTPTLMQSETPKPSATEPSPTYTPLPVPELSAQEIKKFIVQLIKGNAGCTLPCWWGITPGKTSWYDAYNFLKPMSTKFHSLSYDNQPGEWINEFYFDVPEYIDQHREVFQTYITHSSTIDMIITDTASVQSYNLKDLLIAFGVPSQVWLYTISEPREGYLPFELLVLFEEQGIMAKYDGFAGYQNGSVRICPGLVNPELSLWPPDSDITFDLIIKMFWVDQFWFNNYFRPIDKAAGMSVEQFHNEFTGPDAQDCFTTPSEVWIPPLH
jgi:hypothetical protein